jgi:hypothetical protein
MFALCGAASQVYSGSKEDAGDGAWVPVRPVKGSLTINTGDMMQVINGTNFTLSSWIAVLCFDVLSNPNCSAVPAVSLYDFNSRFSISSLYSQCRCGAMAC